MTLFWISLGLVMVCTALTVLLDFSSIRREAGRYDRNPGTIRFASKEIHDQYCEGQGKRGLAVAIQEVLLGAGYYNEDVRDVIETVEMAIAAPMLVPRSEEVLRRNGVEYAIAGLPVSIDIKGLAQSQIKVTMAAPEWVPFTTKGALWWALSRLPRAFILPSNVNFYNGVYPAEGRGDYSVRYWVMTVLGVAICTAVVGPIHKDYPNASTILQWWMVLAIEMGCLWITLNLAEDRLSKLERKSKPITPWDENKDFWQRDLITRYLQRLAYFMIVMFGMVYVQYLSGSVPFSAVAAWSNDVAMYLIFTGFVWLVQVLGTYRLFVQCREGDK